MKTLKTFIILCALFLLSTVSFAQKSSNDITFVCDKVISQSLEYDYEEMSWAVQDSSETTGKFIIKLTKNKKSYQGIEVTCEKVDCTFGDTGGYCQCSSGDDYEYYKQWFSIDLEGKTISEGFESTSYAGTKEYRIVEIIGNW